MYALQESLVAHNVGAVQARLPDSPCCKPDEVARAGAVGHMSLGLANYQHQRRDGRADG